MQLLVEPGGTIRCVYGEEIDLHELGRVSIRRGSHVEPAGDGQWTVDLAPAGGPRLGPFQRRSEALAAERDWLNENWLAPNSSLTVSPVTMLHGKLSPLPLIAGRTTSPAIPP